MNKKQMALEFLKLAGTGKVRDAYDRFIASDFIHHNQYFKGDRESLLTAMEEAHKASPNKDIITKFCYQDGDTVITHSLVVKESAEIAVVHIFRFRNEHIVELWDLGQIIEKNTPNENGLF